MNTSFINKLYIKIVGKYKRVNNNMAKDALAILDRIVDTVKYKYPECGEFYTNDIRFQDHIQYECGYPSDFDIIRFYDVVTPKSFEKIS